MSVENIDKFYALAFQNPELVEPLKAATDEASFAEIAVQLGAANDCSFTGNEVLEWRESKMLAQQNGELDDLQLEAVSGGKVSAVGVAAIVGGSLLIVGGVALAATGVGLAGGVGAVAAGSATITGAIGGAAVSAGVTGAAVGVTAVGVGASTDS